MNQQEQLLFNAGVKGELRTIGYVTEGMSEEKIEDLSTLYIDAWLSDPEVENFFTDYGVVDCLVHFKSWLQTAPKIEGVHITPVNITVSITIPVGTNGANIGLSMSAIPSGDLTASFVEIYDGLVEAGNAFRAKRLGSKDAGARTDTQGNTNAGGSERIHVEVVKVEHRNGKTYYRCGGGRWVKFGVAAWPEVWKAAGIDPTKYDIGDNKVSFDAILEIGADGKPAKVTEIITK